MKKSIFYGSILSFLIPEVLWSPIINLCYSLLKPTINGSSQIWRDNSLMNSNVLLLLVLGIQFLGILGCLIFILRSDLTKVIKVILGLLLIVLIIFTGILLILMFSIRHGIGF